MDRWTGEGGEGTEEQQGLRQLVGHVVLSSLRSIPPSFHPLCGVFVRVLTSWTAGVVRCSLPDLQKHALLSTSVSLKCFTTCHTSDLLCGPDPELYSALDVEM